MSSRSISLVEILTRRGLGSLATASAWTTTEKELIVAALADELLERGLNADNEVNEYGVAVDKLIAEVASPDNDSVK